METDFIPRNLILADKNQVVVIAHVESIGKPMMVDAERYRMVIRTVSGNQYAISSASKDDALQRFEDIIKRLGEFYASRINPDLHC